MKGGLFGVVLLAGVAGCALPIFGGRSTPVQPTEQVAVDSATPAPPIVEVRDFTRSSVVSVLAWDADEARIGLRAEISRNGTLVGWRAGDHLLYLTPFYAWYMGGFVHATAEPGKPLMRTGELRDSYSCFFGRRCSPLTYVAVRLPDALLRASRDSLVVTFIPTGRDSWTVTLRRELIAAFLTKVDSVVAEMR